MSQKTALDKFGQFITEKLRHNSIGFAENVLEGKYKSQRLIELHRQLCSLNEEQQQIALTFVRRDIDTCIHNFLFALVEKMRYS